MDTGKIKALATGARVQLMDGVRASLERVLAPDSAESINEPSRVNELRGEAKDKDATSASDGMNGAVIPAVTLSFFQECRYDTCDS